MNFLKFKITAIKESNGNRDGDDFIKIEKELNEAKSLLDNIPEDEYYHISSRLDAFRTMKKTLSYQYKMQIVTNATMKIYELLSQMKLINSPRITAFCNAELLVIS